MESTIASRNCSNFSFCPLVKESSRRGLWLSRKISAGEFDVRARPAFGRANPLCFALALLADGRLTAFFAGLAGFFALWEAVFFFDFAIKIKSRAQVTARGERLIKNKS